MCVCVCVCVCVYVCTCLYECMCVNKQIVFLISWKCSKTGKTYKKLISYFYMLDSRQKSFMFEKYSQMKLQSTDLYVYVCVLGSIQGRVIPKTLKMELDTTLLNTQHYKVRFKGKVEQSWEWSSALPYTLV